MRPGFFSVTMIGVFLLAATAVSGQTPGPKPWEDPASGFTPTGTISNGNQKIDKIEPVIKTTGGQKDDGTTTTNAGTSDQQSWVNGFLNNTAEKVKTGGVISGSAWTWQKSWKIGPDGKPYEVSEAFQEGVVNGNLNTGQPPGTPSTSNPSAPPTPPSAGNPPAAPTPGSPPGSPASTNPPTSTPPGTTVSTPPPNRPDVPFYTPKTPTVKPVDISQPVLPPAPIKLVIHDPIALTEQPFGALVNPATFSLFPPVTAKADPVPEDTRVKVGLELDQNKVKPEDVSLTLTDNEGDHLIPKELYNSQYRHIFRIPSLDQYKAVVSYRHPMDPDKKSLEVIHVTIPVYKLGFKNRTIDAHQFRGEQETP